MMKDSEFIDYRLISFLSVLSASSQKHDDMVTFVHTFKLPAREVKHMMPRQFVTVYEYGLINWWAGVL